MNKEDQEFKRSFLYNFGVYSGIGVQLVVAVILGMFGGEALDTKLGTKPAFFIIGLLLGMGAGFYNLVRLLNAQKRKNSYDADHNDS